TDKISSNRMKIYGLNGLDRAQIHHSVAEPIDNRRQKNWGGSMRTSLPSRAAPAYRQALRHPVFMQSTPEHDIVAVAQATLPPPVAPLGSPDLCSQERRAVLESMLRFFDVAHRC